MFVVAACADQAEEINRLLKLDNKPRVPYHILDVLPNGENSLEVNTTAKSMGEGTEGSLNKLIGPSSSVYTTIKKVAWENENNTFGPVVCLVLFKYPLLFVQPLHQFLNPTMVQRDGSVIGKFLTKMKTLYLGVCPIRFTLNLFLNVNRLCFSLWDRTVLPKHFLKEDTSSMNIPPIGKIISTECSKITGTNTRQPNAPCRMLMKCPNM